MPTYTPYAHIHANLESPPLDKHLQVLGYQAQVDGNIMLNQFQQAFRGGFRGRGGYAVRR
jgi:hypothetical protein